MAVQSPKRSLHEGSLDLPAVVLNKVRELAARGMTNSISGEIDPKTVQMIGSWLGSVQWWMVATDQIAANEWRKIGEHPPLTAYVLEYTNALFFHLHGWGIADEVIGWLAEAYGQNGQETSAIHPDLRSKLPSVFQLTSLYRSNPWLLASVLLYQTGMVGEIVRPLTQQQPRATS